MSRPLLALTLMTTLAACEKKEEPSVCEIRSEGTVQEKKLPECLQIQAQMIEALNAKTELEQALTTSGNIQWESGHSEQETELLAAQTAAVANLLAQKISAIDSSDPEACATLKDALSEVENASPLERGYSLGSKHAVDIYHKDSIREQWEAKQHELNANTDQTQGLDASNLCVIIEPELLAPDGGWTHVDAAQEAKANKNSFEAAKKATKHKKHPTCDVNTPVQAVKIKPTSMHENEIAYTEPERFSFTVCSRGDEVITLALINLSRSEGSEFFSIGSQDAWMAYGRKFVTGGQELSSRPIPDELQLQPSVPKGQLQTFEYTAAKVWYHDSNEGR